MFRTPSDWSTVFQFYNIFANLSRSELICQPKTDLNYFKGVAV